MAFIRTFIAIEIPDGIRAEANRAVDVLAQDEAAVRWVEPEGMHLTLVFLGDVLDRDTHSVCRNVADAVNGHKSFLLDCTGLDAFPNAERPRTIWAGVRGDIESLEQLHRSIQDGMADLGFPPEARRFQPHITLGRLKRGRRISQPCVDALSQFAETPFGTLRVEQVVVYSSELTKEGPIYTPMSRARLG